MTLDTKISENTKFGAAAMLKTIDKSTNGYSWKWVYNIAELFKKAGGNELLPNYGLYVGYINLFANGKTNTFVEVEKLRASGFTLRVLFIAVLLLGSIALLIIWSNSKYVPRPSIKIEMSPRKTINSKTESPMKELKSGTEIN